MLYPHRSLSQVKQCLVRLVILGPLLVTLFSCAHLKRPATIPIDHRCFPGQILSMMKDSDTPQALKGIAKIKVESPDEKFSVKEFVIAKRPGSLRLETLGFLGHTEFVAVTDGKELFLFSPSDNTFYHGAPSPENLSRFIPLHLSLEEMVSILLGNIPLIDYDAQQVDGQAEDDGCLLRLSSEDGRYKQVLNVSLSRQKVVESKTYEEGALILLTRYRRYDEVGETLFPRDIVVSMPRDQTTVTIQFKDIELLSTIPPAEFKLTPPQGAGIIPLE